MSEQKKYSNVKAFKALVVASLLSRLKSTSTVVFTIAFPLVFILVFGFLGGKNLFSLKVALAPSSDTTNALYSALKKTEALNWKDVSETTNVEKILSEDDIVAVIDIQKLGKKYDIKLTSSVAQTAQLEQLKSLLKNVLQSTDPEIVKRAEELADIETEVINARAFKTIDFILPGQLGFSLLGGSVFGTAFIFYNLRETLVLKRFFATPVSRVAIVLSEGVSRMILQLVGAIIIIAIGYYALDYTLINGFLTFVKMVTLSALGILVFMGFGFVISGVAKNENIIPPISNLVTLPQFLLAGTFFPIDVFPTWLQPFCKILPLTYLNDAMRKVAFDGASFWTIKLELAVLLVWGIVLYIAASKVFRWE